MRCKDCKHWYNRSYMNEPTELGYCKAIQCEDTNTEHARGLNVLAIIDYPVAELITAPDFGCVLFKKAAG